MKAAVDRHYNVLGIVCAFDFMFPKSSCRVDCKLPDTFKMYAITVDRKRIEVFF